MRSDHRNLSRRAALAMGLTLLAGTLTGLAGCGGERLESGSQVEVSDDALADAERSAAFYDQQGKGGGPK